MKQARLVILSLVLLLALVSAKSGLSHRAKKLHRLNLRQEVPTEQPVKLLNPLRSTTAYEVKEVEEVEVVVPLSLRIVTLKND